MNDFIEKLIALRSGAGRVGGKVADVARGTLSNMKDGLMDDGSEWAEMERERNRKLIESQPGGMRAFEERRMNADPEEERKLFGNPYVNAIRALLGKN